MVKLQEKQIVLSLFCNFLVLFRSLTSFYGLNRTLKLTISALLFYLWLCEQKHQFSLCGNSPNTELFLVLIWTLFTQIFNKNGKTKSWDYIKSEYNLEDKLKYHWI